jgi:hypothetical protein
MLSATAFTVAGYNPQAAVENGLQRTEAAGLRPANLGAWDETPANSNGCHVGWKVSTARLCRSGAGEKTVVVAGDSHAAALYTTFKTWAQANNWTFVSVTKRGCPFVDVMSADPLRAARGEVVPYPSCYAWRRDAMRKVKALKADLVVLPLMTNRTLVKPGIEAQWRTAISHAVTELATVSSVVAFGDDPRVGIDIPSCLKRHPHAVQRCTTNYNKAVSPTRLAMERAATEAGGGSFFDISPWFCTPKGCPASVGGVVVRRDDNHITNTFARFLAKYISVAVQDGLKEASGRVREQHSLSQ